MHPEPRVSHMLGKPSATDHNPSPSLLDKCSTTELRSETLLIFFFLEGEDRGQWGQDRTESQFPRLDLNSFRIPD